MARLLEDLSKNLAGGMTRRRALALFGTGIAASTVWWRKTDTALAMPISNSPCFNFCWDLYGPTYHGADNEQLFSICIQSCRNIAIPRQTTNVCPPGTSPIAILGGRYKFNGNTPFPYGSFALCSPYMMNGIGPA